MIMFEFSSFSQIDWRGHAVIEPIVDLKVFHDDVRQVLLQVLAQNHAAEVCRFARGATAPSIAALLGLLLEKTNTPCAHSGRNTIRHPGRASSSDR